LINKEVVLVTLFSTKCPKCNTLEMQLLQKKIDFKTETNMQEVIDAGYMEAPVLKVDNNYYNFSEAIKWVRGVE